MSETSLGRRSRGQTDPLSERDAESARFLVRKIPCQGDPLLETSLVGEIFHQRNPLIIIRLVRELPHSPRSHLSERPLARGMCCHGDLLLERSLVKTIILCHRETSRRRGPLSGRPLAREIHSASFCPYLFKILSESIPNFILPLPP